MFECSVSQATARRCHRGAEVVASPQLVDGVFQNPEPPRDDLLEAARRWLRGNPNREPAAAIPTIRQDARDFSAASDELFVTWLGHSTVLIELGGRRVLTDPVWSERVSPLRKLGPRRFFAPPIALDGLPPVDLVVISHDHYDHLDRAAVHALARRGAAFAVPLGVGSRMRAWGIDAARITELDWWQETTIEGLRLVCTPARHFSGRGVLDRNRTLWSGWAIMSPIHTVFFSGDSGMSSHFEEIGRRLGPFDLTLMEIGAYDSSWPDVHMGPENAVAAHRMVRGQVLLPIHWATFNLALHSWTEPGDRVSAAAARDGVHLVTPRPGERLRADRPPRTHAWWPAVDPQASTGAIANVEAY